MARRWRCLHADIVLSEALRRVPFFARLLYTWGIPQLDAYGVIRRDRVKRQVFPDCSSRRAVDAALDQLLEVGKLCSQRHQGDEYLHWCFWDEWQGELVRKGRGPPLFDFHCPNEDRAIQRDEAPHRASSRPTIHHNTLQDNTVQQSREPAPPQPPASEYARAILETWPTASGTFYQAYFALEHEYGAEAALAAFRDAQRSRQPRPSVKYLQAILDRCQAEGVLPGEHSEKRQGHNDKPTEIDGKRVAYWIGDSPVFAVPSVS